MCVPSRDHLENVLAKRYLKTFLGILNKHTGRRGTKNEWIQSKSNLENSKHFYFSILCNKQIAIDCQI